LGVSEVAEGDVAATSFDLFLTSSTESRLQGLLRRRDNLIAELHHQELPEPPFFHDLATIDRIDGDPFNRHLLPGRWDL